MSRGEHGTSIESDEFRKCLSEKRPKDAMHEERMGEHIKTWKPDATAKPILDSFRSVLSRRVRYKLYKI